MSAVLKPAVTLRGLPGPLPEGERLLWQGSPDWRIMARDVFHFRGLSLYFAVIVAWCVGSYVLSGEPATEVLLSTAKLLGATAVPLAVIALYSWMASRAAIYTVTDARVVIRLGLAVPMTINLPYSKIDSAALKLRNDGSGDISLLLTAPERLGYVVLWPHARPWRTKSAEPTLRAIPDAARVGQLMARALAASADMPAPAMADQPSAPLGQHEAVPA